jgi:hypothetical protein
VPRYRLVPGQRFREQERQLPPERRAALRRRITQLQDNPVDETLDPSYNATFDQWTVPVEPNGVLPYSVVADPPTLILHLVQFV